MDSSLTRAKAKTSSKYQGQGAGQLTAPCPTATTTTTTTTTTTSASRSSTASWKKDLLKLETSLLGTLYREFREFMRILMTFLGKTKQKCIIIRVVRPFVRILMDFVEIPRKCHQNSHEFSRFPKQCTQLLAKRFAMLWYWQSFLSFFWEKLNRGVSKPGGFPLFSGKVQIVSRTLSGLFLVGALYRLRKRKGTNRENPPTIPEQIGKIPEKSGKSQKGQKGQQRKDKSRSGNPPFETAPFGGPWMLHRRRICLSWRLLYWAHCIGSFEN